MEERLLSPKVNKRAYITARLIEALDDIDVAVNLWLSERTRNAAGKVFGSVKALLSALVTKELDRLSGIDEWYVKRGYAVPTHAIKGVTKDLSDLGYPEVSSLASLAMDLHDYQYNGFDPDYSRYRKKEEVLHDLICVAEAVLKYAKRWFPEYFDEKLETLYNFALTSVERLKRDSKV